MEMETIKQIRRRETPAYFTLTWLECSEACKRWCSIKKKDRAASGKKRGQTLQRGTSPAPRGKREPSACFRLETAPCFQSGGLGSLPRPNVVVMRPKEASGFADSCRG